jgi:hypothetical protein
MQDKQNLWKNTAGHCTKAMSTNPPLQRTHLKTPTMPLTWSLLPFAPIAFLKFFLRVFLYNEDTRLFCVSEGTFFGTPCIINKITNKNNWRSEACFLLKVSNCHGQNAKTHPHTNIKLPLPMAIWV